MGNVSPWYREPDSLPGLTRRPSGLVSWRDVVTGDWYEVNYLQSPGSAYDWLQAAVCIRAIQ